MPTPEPPTPTHEEMKMLLVPLDLVEPLRAYIAASEQKDARIAELEKSVDFWRDSLEACKRNGATLVARIAELEREVAELRKLHRPGDRDFG